MRGSKHTYTKLLWKHCIWNTKSESLKQGLETQVPQDRQVFEGCSWLAHSGMGALSKGGDTWTSVGCGEYRLREAISSDFSRETRSSLSCEMMNFKKLDMPPHLKEEWYCGPNTIHWQEDMTHRAVGTYWSSNPGFLTLFPPQHSWGIRRMPWTRTPD